MLRSWISTPLARCGVAACTLLLALPAAAAGITTAPLTARGAGATAGPVTTGTLSARGLSATDAVAETPPEKERTDLTFTPAGERDAASTDSDAPPPPEAITTQVLSARGLAGNGAPAPITTGALTARGLGEATPSVIEEAETPAAPVTPYDPSAPAVIGKVMDAISGQSVANVLITDAGGALRACSDADGLYRLSVRADRSYTLRLVRRGYEPTQINVYSGSKETFGDALLLPAPGLLLADCQGTPAKAESPPWAGKRITIPADANASIVGRVLDAATGLPLPWAVIGVSPGGTFVTTNARGEYVAPVRVDGVVGDFKVSVEAEGYELPGGAIAIAVGRDRSQFGDVLMVPVAPPPAPLELADRTKLREMQDLLTSQGFDLGASDGIVGGRTRQAIRDFQASRGLAPDGAATEALLDILRAVGPGPVVRRTPALSLFGYAEEPVVVRADALSLVGHGTVDPPIPPAPPPVAKADDAPAKVAALTLKSVRLMRVVPLAGIGDVNPFSVRDVEDRINPRPLIVAGGGTTPGGGTPGGGETPGGGGSGETPGGGDTPIGGGTGSGAVGGGGGGVDLGGPVGSGGIACVTPVMQVIPANDAFSLVVDPATGSCGFTQFPDFPVAQFGDCYGGLCVEGRAPWTIAPMGLLPAFTRVRFTIANGANRFTFTASVWGTDPTPAGTVIGSRTSGGERADGEFVDKVLVIESFTRSGG